MPSLHDALAHMGRGIFASPGDAAPAGILDDALGASRRLDIYRNNVLSNYRNALRDTYPVIVALVGDRFFDATAHRYARKNISLSGDLNDYGEDFALFLAGFEPAQGLPYLADVARLEWAVHRAFHAADADALQPAALAAVNETQLASLRFTLHPAAGLVESHFPIAHIWRIGQPDHEDDSSTLSLDDNPQKVLVMRHDFAVDMEVLSRGAFVMLSALSHGQSLQQALQPALDSEPEFNLGAFLAHHIQQSTLIAFQI